MKRFYNWFHVFYGMIERGLGSSMDAVIAGLFGANAKYRASTAIEYACGSGSVARKLAPVFASVEGRDSSTMMLARARRLAKKGSLDIRFEEGNILDIGEPDGSFDFVFVSFALHLFSKDDILSILKRLLLVAREELVIIDHPLEWSPFTALIEWLEGSYYDQFIKLDFASLAREAGAGRFSLDEVAGCAVMRMSL